MCWRVASTGIPQRREPKLLLSVPEVIALIYENTELTYKLLITNLFQSIIECHYTRHTTGNFSRAFYTLLCL